MTAKYELIDKDGKRHGPFNSPSEAWSYAASQPDDQEQDEEQSGRGCDMQIVDLR